jgi:hypothetical protein
MKKNFLKTIAEEKNFRIIGIGQKQDIKEF